jgi:transglutaminase-like putative cysteine protease
MNQPASKASVRLMLASLASGAVLHADRVPLWCLVAVVGALVWHWLYSVGKLKLPERYVVVLLALALMSGIAASFGTFSGLSAGTALLLVMGAAKLLETRTPRDVAVVTVVALVLVLAACLDRQSLPRLPLYLASGWTALATLAASGSVRASASPARAYGLAGRALLPALPFAVLCFVLVPRMPGALWSMPPGEGAQSGLADEMSPGSISELSLSDDIAFRARFDAAAPPLEQRYWRGPVLHDFDGYTWRRVSRFGGGAPEQKSAPLSAPLRYQVILEPTNRVHLFGLDTVASIEGRRNFRTFDGQILTSRAITAAITYNGVSHLRTRFEGPLSRMGRRLDTALPEGRNPRSIALARTIRAQAISDQQYSNMILEYFREAGFEYTTTPPLLDLDSVDDLVFNTKRGFCGHFASAYATFMRAAGVPARVVTGYFGGRWNPVGGYYTIRQAQAHAWTEIWIEGEGWTRIDPTAVVAPERLEQGAEGLLEGRRAIMRGLPGDALWLQNLSDYWDAAGGWWQENIVGFNRGAQLNLLRRLGLDEIDFPGMTLLLAGGATLWALALWAIARRRSSGARPDAIARIWNQYVALLASRGVTVAAHDGTRAAAAKAGGKLPLAAAEIGEFTALYERLRFGTDESSEEALRSLRALLDRIARATTTGRRRRTAAAGQE